MAERFTIQAINSIEPDTATDVVHVECLTNGGNAEVDVHSGALSTLTLGLLQASQAFSATTEEYSGQPLELTGAGLVLLEDGRLMLELVLDGSLRVVVNVPYPAMPALQECLFAMDEIRDGQAAVSASAPHH
jgi:hypothetical protein